MLGSETVFISELELMRSQMTQKTALKVEVSARMRGAHMWPVVNQAILLSRGLGFYRSS